MKMIPLGCRTAQYWQVQCHSYFLQLAASFLVTGHQHILERQIKRNRRQLNLFSTNHIPWDIKHCIYTGQCFLTFLAWGTLKTIFLSQGTLTYENVYRPEKVESAAQLTATRQKRQLVVHKDYSSIANYRTKIPMIFWWIFGILWGISTFLFIYSTITCWNPNDVLRNPRVPQNPDWEIMT
jgi:hypothetical protein